MFKSYSIIELNRHLSSIAKGMDEAVNKFTIIKSGGECGGRICSALCCMMTMRVVEKNGGDGGLMMDLVKNENLGVVYYEFSNVTPETKLSLSFDWVGNDMVLNLYLNMPPTSAVEGLAALGIRNGFINLPAWNKIAVITNRSIYESVVEKSVETEEPTGGEDIKIHDGVAEV